MHAEVLLAIATETYDIVVVEYILNAIDESRTPDIVVGC